MRADSPLQSVADLKGKKIGFAKAAGVHYLLIAALDKAGLSFKDIEPAYLTPADGRAAFERGAIDAWVVWDPFLSAAQRQSKLRVLADGTGIASYQRYYLARTSFANARPDVLRVIYAELHKAGLWVKQKPAEAAALLAPVWGLDVATVEQANARRSYAVRPVVAAAWSNSSASPTPSSPRSCCPENSMRSTWRCSTPESEKNMSAILQQGFAGVRLEARGLHKRYGTREVLRNTQLTIEPGQFIAIVGRSGCGKSTLLRLIAGLEEASDGGLLHRRQRRRRRCTTTRGSCSRRRACCRGAACFENVTLGLPARGARARRGGAAQVGLADRTNDGRRACRAGSASASRSRVRWCITRDCCCSTSRWARSTRSRASRCTG